MQSEPFYAIMRRQLIHAPNRARYYNVPSRERSIFHFRAQPLPIHVIWPKYATRAISRDSATATSIAHPFPQAIIPSPPEGGPIIIFARDRFQYKLFGLNMQHERFRAIPSRHPHSRAHSRIMRRQLIHTPNRARYYTVPSRERSIFNFRARPLLIKVIWPKYPARAILRYFEMATSSRAHSNRLLYRPLTRVLHL